MQTKLMSLFALAADELLTARRARIITLRYGLLDGKPRTFEETAKEFSLTRERIRQLVKATLRSLYFGARKRAKEGKAGSHGALLFNYINEAVRPGEPGDTERLLTLLRDELPHLPSESFIRPLVELFLRRPGKPLSPDDPESPQAIASTVRPASPLGHPQQIDATNAEGPHVSNYWQRFAEIRQTYPRAYEPWSSQEDAQLAELVDEDRTVKQIAALLQRRPGAISSRIRKAKRKAAKNEQDSLPSLPKTD